MSLLYLQVFQLQGIKKGNSKRYKFKGDPTLMNTYKIYPQ